MAKVVDERGMRDVMLERQWILIREANYVRSVLDLAPVASTGGAAAGADDDLSPVAGLSVDQLSSLRPTHNRRAVLQAVLDVLRDGQDATYSVIRAWSGVPERRVTRALRCAQGEGVLRLEGGGVRTGGGVARETIALLIAPCLDDEVTEAAVTKAHARGS